MSAIWKVCEGTQEQRPLEIEGGISTVYLRRNIVRAEKEDEMSGETIEFWRYEERQMTYPEYEEYLKDMESPSAQSILQQISDIQAEQTMSSIIQEANTEIVMQTLSDIQADIAMLG